MLKGRPVIHIDLDKLEEWATRGLIIYTERGWGNWVCPAKRREDKMRYLIAIFNYLGGFIEKTEPSSSLRCTAKQEATDSNWNNRNSDWGGEKDSSLLEQLSRLAREMVGSTSLVILKIHLDRALSNLIKPVVKSALSRLDYRPSEVPCKVNFFYGAVLLFIIKKLLYPCLLMSK